MSVKQRLKRYLKDQGIKINAFELKINASNGYVNSISKSIGADKLIQINRNYSNLNTNWLLTGNGEMYNNEDSNSYNQFDQELTQEEIRVLSEIILLKEKSALKLSFFAKYIKEKELNARIEALEDFEKMKLNKK